jgi:hypothetical protein
MDIERLKELSDCGRELYMLNDENLMERIQSDNQLQNYLSDSVDAIDEAIARQSVKSEDVAEAIDVLKELQHDNYVFQNYTEQDVKNYGFYPCHHRLQAYQQVAISKTENNQ